VNRAGSREVDLEISRLTSGSCATTRRRTAAATSAPARPAIRTGLRAPLREGMTILAGRGSLGGGWRGQAGGTRPASWQVRPPPRPGGSGPEHAQRGPGAGVPRIAAGLVAPGRRELPADLRVA